MLVPDVKKFELAKDFFDQFLILNRENDDEFSLRTFAKKIGWPHSLLRDMAIGEKRLTVLRAIEFSKHSKMDAFDTEYLINLALCENDEAAVKTHFRKLISQQKKDPNQSDLLKNNPLFRDARLFAVYAFIASHRQLPSARQIASSLYTFSMDELEAQSMIDTLVAADLVTNEVGKLPVADHTVFFREDPDKETLRSVSAAQLHRQFIKSLDSYLEIMARPRLLGGGFALLTSERFEQLKEKGLQYVRSIEINSDEAYRRIGDHSETGNEQLFQYYIAMVPISE